MMQKPTVCLLLILMSACAISCGRHKLNPDEVQRNRLFSEILKRSDRRTLGDDGFFQHMLLSPPYPEVGEWCALALGRIGDPRALPWIYDALGKEDARLRAAALFALGEIEDRDTLRQQGLDPAPEAVSRARTMLADRAPVVRMRALEALGKIGEPADASIVAAAMRRTGQARSREARVILSLGITALMRLNNHDEYALLRSLAADPDPELRWRALNALFRLRDQGACAIFRDGLRDSDPDVRAHAARGLGVCAGATDAQPLVPIVGESSQPASVRICALRALGDLRNPAAVPAIVRALVDCPLDSTHPEQVNFAAEAAAALGQIASAEAAPALCRLLSNEGAARDAALVALAQVLRSDPDRFFAVIRDRRFSGAAATRAWVRALGELGGDRGLRELRSILRDSLEQTANTSLTLSVPALVGSLAAARAPDLPEIARALLRSRDGAVLRAALAAYSPGTLGQTPWRPIAESYIAIAGGHDIETKTALLNRLEPWVHEPEVTGLLERALGDRSRNARIAAARLLRRAGRAGVPDDPGPAETSVSDISYDLAASGRKERTIACIETDRGDIELELFREDAPLTVTNFVQLAQGRFYNGLSFMRVVPYFVVQGGDPRNDQEGGPGYSIRCEINMRPFERGSLGMALAGKDTGGSQFFITLSPQPHLDGGYTCFGRVIAGMSVVDHITTGDTIKSIKITEDVTMIDFRRF